MRPAISFVIPVKNGMPGLETCLRAIRKQAEGLPHEIVILDSASSDGSAACARHLGCFVHPVDPARYGHGRTRNRGAELARGEILVFLSQDALPRPGWLEGLLDALYGDPTLAGVCSRHVAPPDASPSVARALAASWPAGATTARRFESDEAGRPPDWLFFSNTSSAIRRAVWERHPFPEVRFGEDVAWARRVLAAGHAVATAPASVVLHAHDEPPGERFANNVDHMRGMSAIQGRLPIPSLPVSLVRAGIEAGRDLAFHRRRSGSRGGIPVGVGTFLRALAWQLAGHLGAWLGARCHRPFLAAVADAVSRQPRGDGWASRDGATRPRIVAEENPLVRPPEALSPRRWIAALVGLAVLLLLLHGRSLELGFLSDDAVILHRASQGLATALSPPKGWFFRPVVFVLFRALSPPAPAPVSPLPFRLLVLGLQLLLALLVLRLGRRLGLPFSAALLGAGLYLLYPFHTEGMLWIAALTDLVMAVALVAGLLAWIAWSDGRGRPAYLLTLALSALALFTKQTAAVFPLMALAWELLARNDRPLGPRLPALAALFCPLLAFFALRGESSPLFVHAPASILRSLAASTALVVLPEPRLIVAAHAVESFLVGPGACLLALAGALLVLDRRTWLCLIWALLPMALIAVFQGGPQGRYMVLPGAFAALLWAGWAQACWTWSRGRSPVPFWIARGGMTMLLLVGLQASVSSWHVRHRNWAEADRLARRALEQAVSLLRDRAATRRVVLVNVPDSLPDYGPWRAYVWRNGLDDAVERRLRGEGIRPREVVEAITPVSDWSNSFRWKLDAKTHAGLLDRDDHVLLHWDPWEARFVLSPDALTRPLFPSPSDAPRPAPGRIRP